MRVYRRPGRKCWYIDFRVPEQWRIAGCPDKKATQELGRRVESVLWRLTNGEAPRGELGREIEGLPAAVRDRVAAFGLLSRGLAALRPLDELVVEWGRSLGAKSGTKEHVSRSLKRVRAVLGALGITRWSELRPERIEIHLAALRAGDPAAIEAHVAGLGDVPGYTRRRERARLGADGLGAKASNHYLATIRSLTRWALARGYASDDPLRVLEPLNTRTDRRLLRRALTEEQLGKLISTTAGGPEVGGVPGRARALLYLLAAETGLRARELASLRIASFDFERRTITLAAEASKHRREDLLPLRRATAALLARVWAGRGALESAFGLAPGWRAARAIRADLEAAGLAYEDESGRVCDFHSLRGLFATRLLAAGADPRVAQRLMRHSTAELTVGLYAKLRPGEDRDALERLPDAVPSGLLDEGVEALQKATGTGGWWRIGDSNPHPSDQKSARTTSGRPILPADETNGAPSGASTLGPETETPDPPPPNGGLSVENRLPAVEKPAADVENSPSVCGEVRHAEGASEDGGSRSGARSVLPLKEQQRSRTCSQGSSPEFGAWLRANSTRLAAAVEATSARADVRETRAAIVLVLLTRACPLGSIPRLDWYVPGACARFGARGIAKHWPSRSAPHPSVRRIKAHLRVLERAGVLVTSPGEAVQGRPGRRYPDTLHLLYTEREALYWLGPGRDLLLANPEARWDPAVWKRFFAGWRSGEQLELGFERPQGAELEQELAKLAQAGESTDLLAGLSALGIDIRGRERARLARDRRRLREAVARLSMALRRGDRVRAPAGWLVSAAAAQAQEQAAALQRRRELSP